MKIAPILASFLVAGFIHACAEGETIDPEADDTAPAVDASADGAPSTGGSATTPTGGGPSTTAGAGGVGGGGGLGATGGSSDTDAAAGAAGASAMPDAAMNDGGSMLVDAAPACPDPTTKRCGGLCVPPNPAIGCSLDDCTACPDPPLDGFSQCDGTTCSFGCNSGFTVVGNICEPDGTGGPDGGTLPPACMDGLPNGAETDVDCGGTECNPCSDGMGCNFGSDCTSNSCVGSVCQPARCDDGVQNALETDVDCGGNCGATCTAGSACSVDGDCANGPCVNDLCTCTPLTCAVGQCGTGFDDGCGGTFDCTCPSGDVCNAGTCCTPDTCADYPASCGDLSNGCGATMNCDSNCTGGDVCDLSGACCTPVAACAVSEECGTIDDACGGTVACGSCATAVPCPSNTCDTSVAAFGYTPSNFDPRDVDQVPESTVLDCGVSTFNSTDLTFSNWCASTPPIPIVRSQAGGPDVVILALSDLTVAVGSTLRLIGNRPVILAVYGDAAVAGTIDAGAQGSTPGAGGNVSCSGGAGTNGAADSGTNDGAPGGGGGGFGTPGGAGGDGQDTPASPGGSTVGTPELVPLRGGCPGGKGGDGNGTGGPGGAGGGAVQLSVAGAFSIDGVIAASGGGGSRGSGDEDGGGGGGSGGGVLIEADTIDGLSTGWITANGGGGAEGNDSSSVDGSAGTDGYTASRAQAPGGSGHSGGDGGDGASIEGAAGNGGNNNGGDAAGGGGGGMGRIRINAAGACRVATGGSGATTLSGSCTSCFDGIQNADEGGIDCDGSCVSACHCLNGTPDADETGRDCGGVDCVACVPPDGTCTQVINVDNNTPYWFCADTRDWTTARDNCASIGYALVTVNDAAENTFVQTNIGSDAWIGFNDRSNEGSFVWVGAPSTYTNWDSQEPNNDCGLFCSENCAEIRTTGFWNDGECGNTRQYVCEDQN